MILALDWKSMVHMLSFCQNLEKGFPSSETLLAAQKCMHIADHDKAISCSCDHDIQALRGRHEPNLVLRIASSEGYDCDITLFALIVIYNN